MISINWSMNRIQIIIILPYIIPTLSIINQKWVPPLTCIQIIVRYKSIIFGFFLPAEIINLIVFIYTEFSNCDFLGNVG